MDESNIQIAKPASSPGSFVGVSAGSFTALAQANLLDVHPDCGQTGSPCPFTPFRSSANGSIYQPVPTKLAILPPDSTTAESGAPLCSVGCGVARSFTYQVSDQFGMPLQVAGLQVCDSIAIPSPNPLNVTSFMTTCTPANTGPCGVVTNSNGQFAERNVGVCAPACKSNGVCIAGGPSVTNQTYHIGTSSIVQSIGYYCSKTTVNGQ